MGVRMKSDGGDTIAQALRVNGVRFIFTRCGSHISPILVGCNRHGIRVIDVRDEASAVFAADAVARLTGVPGVAVVTAGPGVTNTITAVKNAQRAQSPLILLGGSAPTILKNRGARRDMDPIHLLKPVVKTALSIRRARDLVPVMKLTFLAARSGAPGPVFVDCPMDLLYGEALVRRWCAAPPASCGQAQPIRRRLANRYLNHRLGRLFSERPEKFPEERPAIPPPRASAGQVKKAAVRIATSQKPIMVIGSQAVLPIDKVHDLARAVEHLDIPVYLTGTTRGLLGKNHRLEVRHRRKAALREADVVILAGIPCDFRLGYGRPFHPETTVIAVSRDPLDLKLNRQPDLAINADPCRFVCDLAARRIHYPPKWNIWLQELHETDELGDKRILYHSHQNTEYINPLYFLKKLEQALPENCILIADGGDFAITASRILRPPAPLTWLDCGAFGTPGAGAGFALGAALCRPGAEVWIIYGDGAAAYSLSEFDTFTRHRIPVIAVIGNDAGRTQTNRGQMKFFHDDVGTRLRHTDYHRVAIGYGGRGLLLDEINRIDYTLNEARTIAGRGLPVLINTLIGTTDYRKSAISA